MNFDCGPVATDSVDRATRRGVTLPEYAPESNETAWGDGSRQGCGTGVKLGYELAVWDTPTVGSCDKFCCGDKVRCVLNIDAVT
jgi:hypothetical protein